MVSAGILARLAQTSQDSRLAMILRGMAADEARHASHSWNVISSCIEAGGPPVVSMLRGALRSLPETMSSPLPEQARGGAWERFGIQGEALEKEAWRRARLHATTKLSAMLDLRSRRLAA